MNHLICHPLHVMRSYNQEYFLTFVVDEGKGKLINKSKT